MPPHSPVPYALDVYKAISHLTFDRSKYRSFAASSFQLLLVYCTCTRSSEDKTLEQKLSRYIPFVPIGRLPFQVDGTTYVYPSCDLKFLSGYSGNFSEFIGGVTRIPNPHYFQILEFFFAEDYTWPQTPGYRDKDYLSKEGTRKQVRKERTWMRRYAKRERIKEQRALGLMPPRRKPGTNNGPHRPIAMRKQGPVVAYAAPAIVPGVVPYFDPDSLPNGQNAFADHFAFLSLF
jgi:hypothetical protein